MGETPLYATLLYDVRRQLDISWTEYIYLDMVHHLSYNRWCTKSLTHCGEDLGLSKLGAMKMRDRLIERGLLRKNAQGHLKVTAKFTEVAVNKVTRPVNKVYRGGKQSIPKNNNRNTENIGNGKMESSKDFLERVYGQRRPKPLPPFVIDERNKA